MLQRTVIAAFLCLCIFGCGKTNVLQWAKPSDKTDNIEMARKYLDEGEYTKAKSYVQNETGSEARILYAECLMGEADVDLSTIIEALTDDNVTDNPVLRLEKLIDDADDRAKILEAADIFSTYMPSKTSDKVVGTLCTMIGHVGLVKETFAPNTALALTDGLYGSSSGIVATVNIAGTDITINEANVDSQFSTMSVLAGGNPLNYIKRATTLLSSIGSVPKEVQNAVATLNMTLDTIYNVYTTSNDVTINGVVYPNVNLSSYHFMPWSFAKALCGF